MMISPDVDASIDVNGIRENEIACKQLASDLEDNSGCTRSCSDERFTLGNKCLYVSNHLSTASQSDAVTACQSMGAQLATIISPEDNEWVRDKIVSSTGPGFEAWIGLNDADSEMVFEWQDGTPLVPGYENWWPVNKDGDGDCVVVDSSTAGGGRWRDTPCATQFKYACSMEPLESCNSSEAILKMLRKRTCLQIEANNQDQALNLPAIDVFLNPARGEEKDKVVKEKKDIAKEYFKGSDMKTLFPELFRLLWDSTLPCFEEENKEEHMLLSCELAGLEVNCSDIFTRVPTDVGMCCALNVDDTLRASEYQNLVTQMQGGKGTEKVRSQEGARNGLRLTVDLHSNTVSLGSLHQQLNTFRLFIGEPAQFPMIRDKSITLQPGREHFIDLSATLVTTNGIKGISPDDRGCLFTDESDLEFYKSYTFTNCRLECGIKEAEEEHNCIPWHLPKVGVSSGWNS